MSKPIQEASNKVKQLQQEVNAILKDPVHVYNLLSINTLFNRIQMRLNLMGATLEEPKNGSQETFGPITNFMGEDITKKKEVTASDLNPKEEEKKKFRERVHKLRDEIHSIHPSVILNSYTMADDLLVLRGCAKLAGVEDYDKKEINLKFIEEILTGLDLKEEEAEAHKKAIESSGAVQLTKEMIDADEELKKLKAVAGDFLFTDKEGKKSIRKPQPAKAN